jgi:hypothetical protein
MSRVVFHPDADQEVVETATWYEAQQRGLGSEFLDQMDSAVLRIMTAPEAFGFISGGIRCHLLHRFPYGILYQIQPDRIFVVAVMHLHRDPDYWKHRL